MSRIYPLKLLTPGISKPLKLHTFICERCGEPFELPFWYLKKGRRFCTHACRTQDPLKTLMSRVKKLENGCWQYTGTLGWGGYGQIKVKKKNWLAHRLMWVLWNKRQVPQGMVVRHTCVACPGCINPDHLIIGTTKDNIHDCIKQGRFKSGFVWGSNYLTLEQVREIRSLRKPAPFRQFIKPTYAELAKRFNTKSSVIWRVVNFTAYKNIS